ncbi:MAG: GIY-YIG nuclease family protein [Nitrososphaerales archaeon]|nr:GIY-YIG nuclease family protein [Nitrososphaerales archaeon]
MYIVMCADKTLYTGYTTDPERRVGEHNKGIGSRYTRARRPVELAFLEERSSRESALRREVEIKRLDKSGKLLLCRKYRSREGLS